MLGNMEQNTKSIKKEANSLIESAYQIGYEAGQKNAWEMDVKKYIEQGRKEAWEAARKIALDTDDGGISKDELKEIFGSLSFYNLIKYLSASEVISNLREYEKKKNDEIQVGDEVIINENAISSFKPNTKAIVIMIDGCSRYSYNVMNANGNTHWLEKNEIRKTGRHFPEIVEMLKKLKEEE